LPEPQRRVLLERLNRLPHGEALCHGDLHPLNVILAGDGPVVIDWVDASAGNPLADVARTTVLVTLGELPPGFWARLFVAAFRRRFHAVYLRRYFAGQPEARSEYQLWLPIMSAARLSEGIAEEKTLLLAAVADWLD
jgi:aminoglycoside phosphotransferase (APT) family kinase protein